jgi:hypothetical protein
MITVREFFQYDFLKDSLEVDHAYWTAALRLLRKGKVPSRPFLFIFQYKTESILFFFEQVKEFEKITSLMHKDDRIDFNTVTKPFFVINFNPHKLFNAKHPEYPAPIPVVDSDR